ncbi:MAG: LuxR family transcriptional regulator [Clostridia bacterium]|nr:LuxR family transcriptional regulator [Clostridia bacterium]
MSFSLSVADWMSIVQLIYRMNCIEDFLQYQSKILEIIKMIVPFEVGVFNLADQQQDSVIAGNTCGYNMSDKDLNELTNHGLNNNAFLTSLLLDPSGVVSRGPDLSQFNENNINLENPHLIPQDEQHALTIVLNYKDELLGYITLFREDQGAEFNTRDICVLGNLKNHIALQLYKLSNFYVDMNKLENRRFALEKKLSKYGLSKRELEILALIQSGKTDSEICEQLFFTSSTFKKHLNHIYEKMNVSNRVMLIKSINTDLQ